MKKKISFLLLVLATIFTGCSKDELSNEPVAFKEGQKVTITASVNDNATRATSEYNSGTSKIDFKWSAGDVLTVTAGGKSTTFTMKEVPGEGAGYSTATFEGTMPASGTTFDACFGSLSIPTTQTYDPTVPIPSSALYFTAKDCTLNGDLELKPQTPLLNLNLYGVATISKIVVTKGGTAYTLDCSNAGVGITLNTDETDPSKFFVVIPAGNETFTVRVYDNAPTPSEICSFSKTSTAAVTAGSFLVMPAKEVKKAASAYLCFTAEQAGSTVAMTDAPNLMKSTDGSSFTDWDGSEVTLTNVGDKLYVKANSTGNKVIGNAFSGTGKLKVSGNVMTLLNADSPATVMTTDNNSCFEALFATMPITDISELQLPATELAEGCYSTMFAMCTSLTTIPSGLLPATELAGNCYVGMFAACTSLTTIPSGLLPATTLAAGCYRTMFANCTSLTTIPSGLLPATILAEECYGNMFYYCTSLTTIPSGLLPATTLPEECYSTMFANCTSLTTIPSGLLPATTLADYCYESMFNGCTLLATIPSGLLPATTLADCCYSDMFSKCSSLTTIPSGLLPATTLADYCYYHMFSACSSLTEIPSGLLPATTLAEGCFSSMFAACTSLTTIPSGLLPATTLASADQCYSSMFAECTKLTTIPSGLLPATTLAKSCYYEMFSGCTLLATIPFGLLPATALAGNCYKSMFSKCSSLNSIPELPATALADYCYCWMFDGCTSLTSVDDGLLPATDLKEGCYYGMFKDCSNLTTAPKLPAETLAAGCYREMFYSCSKLSSVTMLATDISAYYYCFYQWLDEAGTSASSRTLYVANGMVDAVKAKVPDNWKDGVQVKP